MVDDVADADEMLRQLQLAVTIGRFLEEPVAVELLAPGCFIMHFLGLGGPRRSNEQLRSVDFWKNELSKAVQEKNQYLEQYAAASASYEEKLQPGDALPGP